MKKNNAITVHIYYTGENGSAKAFVKEMLTSGLVDEIRKEKDTKSDPDCSGCTEVFVCTVFALCGRGGIAWGRCEDIHRMQY